MSKYKMRADQERVKKLLTEAVTLLCRNSLQFEEEVTIEGLIGVTLDKKDIFLVSIQETIETGVKIASKRPVEESDEINDAPVSPNSAKRQKYLHNSNRDVKEPVPSVIQPKIEPIDQDSHNTIRLAETESVKIKEEKNETTNVSNTQTFSSLSNSNVKSHENFHIQNHERSDNNKCNKPSYESDQLNSCDLEIKKEKPDEDPCFVIDSDEEDYSDSYDNNDNSYSDNRSHLSNWQGDGTKLDYVGTDADFMNSSQFQMREQENWGQNFDMSQMAGSSNDASYNMLMDNSFGSNSSQNNSGDPNQRSKEKCPVCLKLVSNLRSHIRLVHKQDRRFHCSECNASFKQKHHLTDHIVYRHSLERPFECNNCGYTFKHNRDLNKHLKTCIKPIADWNEYNSETPF